MKLFTSHLNTLILLLCFFTLSNLSLAQVPQLIQFQALARDNSGNAVNDQTISGTFTIRNGSESILYYREAFLTTTNAFGVFSIRIGENNPLEGAMSAVDWSSDSGVFLDVHLDINGGSNYALLSSSRFVSVPYAFSADVLNDPSSLSLNELGDVSGVPATGQVLQWNGVAWIPATIQAGLNGVDGRSVLNGTVPPAASVGTVGDFYINTSTSQLFGPKTEGGWGNGISLIGPAGPAGPQGVAGEQGPVGATGAVGPQGPAGIAGPSGPQGAAGVAGPAGANGRSVLNGTSNPTVAQGDVNDFFINTSTSTLFGPKTVSGWGIGVSLIGAQGPAGPSGPAGVAGPQGATGATGPAGPQGATGATGPAGANGRSVLNGASNPTLAQGAEGDFFINTSTNVLFGPKTASGWGIGVSLVGPQGPQGPVGPQGPSGSANITGTTNTVAKFTNATTIGNSIMIDNGTGVAVGASTIPAETKLVVGAVNATNEGGQIQLNAPGGSFTTAYHVDNFENRFRIMSGTNTSSTTSRFTINNSGNVGIGNEFPTSRLHVNAGSATALQLEGGVRVSGPLADRAAFQVTASTSNLLALPDGEFSYNVLQLDNTFSNNNPTCMIFITRVSDGVIPPTFNYSVEYDIASGRWRIRRAGNTGGALSIQSGEMFNVMIVDF